MIRFDRQKSTRYAFSLCLLSTVCGCVTNPIPTPTVWDKLGITQATATLRDATVNRRGNFPGLEKKPPLLRLADPRNLMEGQPEMIQTAAKIKQDQDLKKQKIKALKFLAEVNCGCYNKDDAVAKAFLAALEDCDPDVRLAAVEGIQQTAENCNACRRGCEPNCLTEEIAKKLKEMATGVDEFCCPKEPVAEIRRAAAAVLRSCPFPRPKNVIPEELPTPEEYGPEELPLPDAVPERIGGEGDATLPVVPVPGGEGDATLPLFPGDSTQPPPEPTPPLDNVIQAGLQPNAGSVQPVTYRLSGGRVVEQPGIMAESEIRLARRFVPPSLRKSDEAATPLAESSIELTSTQTQPIAAGSTATAAVKPTAVKKAETSKTTEAAKATQVVATAESTKPTTAAGTSISNPEQLIPTSVLTANVGLGEVLLELPDVYRIQPGWKMVAVDSTGRQQFGTVLDSSGRRLLLGLNSTATIAAEHGSAIRIGLIEQ